MKKRSIFGWLGRYVTRWPVSVIGIWLALPTALFFAFPPLSQAIEEHPVPLVPPSAPRSFSRHLLRVRAGVVAERYLRGRPHRAGAVDQMSTVPCRSGLAHGASHWRRAPVPNRNIGLLTTRAAEAHHEHRVGGSEFRAPFAFALGCSVIPRMRQSLAVAVAASEDNSSSTNAGDLSDRRPAARTTNSSSGG